MSILVPLWAWARKHPALAFLGLPLLIVAAVLLALWRVAAGDRDEARKDATEANGRAKSATDSARRTNTVRADEALADREAEAALVEVEARKEQVDERLGLDRARVEDADLDALAREIEARREAGRMR